VIIVHGTIPLRPECREHALQLARRMADATREEIGCISYDFYVGLSGELITRRYAVQSMDEDETEEEDAPPIIH